MSLTSFIESTPTLRARLLSEFKKPDFRMKANLKAPPLTTNHGLTGTAFDYLLRFYVSKLNPNVTSSPWTAEAGLALLSRQKSTFSPAKRLFKEAQSRYQNFLSTDLQRPTRDLIEASVRLAYLENIYRVGSIDKNIFNPVPPPILDDLEAMLSLVDSRYFQAVNHCVLNPTFGSASVLVGGADADLIIDDTLIDIKTGKHLVFDREIFNQLIGYYILFCIGGIDNCQCGSITNLAIYYARYGVLHSVRVSDFVIQERMPVFIEWFKQCARQEV